MASTCPAQLQGVGVNFTKYGDLGENVNAMTDQLQLATRAGNEMLRRYHKDLLLVESAH